MGLLVTLVARESQPLEREFGENVGRWIAHLLASRGIDVRGGCDVAALEGDVRVEAVVTSTGEHLPADLVVVDAGAIPDVALARRAGLALAANGGIACDALLRTSADGVFAAGEVCGFDSVARGRPVRIDHVNHVAEQGRTVARNMLGDEVAHIAVPYFWTELSDWATFECVGPGEPWDREEVSVWFQTNAILVRYLKERRLVAAFGCGRPRDIAAARDELMAAARRRRRR